MNFRAARLGVGFEDFFKRRYSEGIGLNFWLYVHGAVITWCSKYCLADTKTEGVEAVWDLSINMSTIWGKCQVMLSMTPDLGGV